jgi:calcineurin-like phosphoesterase family protein
MIWFTSDLHLGHANIIELCHRPFKDIDDMNAKLIANWNSRVKPEDTVFHLGDFCYRNASNFKNYNKQLNGNKVWIAGNHDGNNGVNTPILDITIHHGGEPLILIHDPADVVNFGGLVLCGHVHANFKFERRYVTIDRKEYTDYCNVGVDVWRFMPININEILAEYKKWKLTQ